MVLENEFKKTLKDMNDLFLKKNKDYSNNECKGYKNIITPEFLGICTTTESVMSRVCDKISRISTLSKTEGKIKDENIEDSLLDIANYCVILLCYLREKNNGVNFFEEKEKK